VRLFPLQAQQVDLSWLPQMGEIALAIVGIIIIAYIFVKKGLPKILEYKKETELARMKIEKEQHFCGNLQTMHEEQLKTIEKIITEDIEKQNKWQDFIEKKVVEIESKIACLVSITADYEELFGSLSQGTLENMLFNDATPVFRRLKAFLRLLAIDVNGRVKRAGFKLILASETNKEIWLDVLETMPKLNLKIVDKEHFSAVLSEINSKIYDGMMR